MGEGVGVKVGDGVGVGVNVAVGVGVGAMIGVAVGWPATCVATIAATVASKLGVGSAGNVHPANKRMNPTTKAPRRLIQPSSAQGDDTPDLLTFQSTVADAVVCRTSHSLLSSSTVYVPLAEAMNE